MQTVLLPPLLPLLLPEVVLLDELEPSGPHPYVVKLVVAARTNPIFTLRCDQFFLCIMMLSASGDTPAPSG